jgi:hypothetical protein
VRKESEEEGGHGESQRMSGRTSESLSRKKSITRSKNIIQQINLCGNIIFDFRNGEIKESERVQ